MTAVVDASVLITVLADGGSEGQWAETAVSSYSLVAPELALVETTNILRRLEIRGKLSTLDATIAQRDLLAFDIEFFAFAPFSERVWAL